MKREGRDVWEHRVRRLRESGLTAKEFAAEIGVNVHTLSGWKWKLEGPGAAIAARRSDARPTQQFVEVVPAEAQSTAALVEPMTTEPFELMLRDGLRVRVPPRFEAQALRALLSALETR